MIEIVHTTNDFIVINKPPGISVHPVRDAVSSLKKRDIFLSDERSKQNTVEISNGVHPGGSVVGETVVDFLLERFPEIRGVGDDPEHRPGIAHRLDKDTSGVMVVARTQEAFERLKHLFKNREIEKTYMAIVCGSPRQPEGVISFPIGRMVKNPLKRGIEQGRSKIRGARPAVTEYRVLKPGKDYSLVELRPKTGRMHQLRVHLKAIGHPIACDRVYGGKNVCCPPAAAEAMAGKPGATRHLLHAQSLSFSYPPGTRLHFEADEPEDFALAEKSII